METNCESCKTCIFLKPVMCHPWNGCEPPDTLPWLRRRIKIGYGSIATQFGWVCTTPELPFIFLDNDNGMCESYTEKLNNG